MTEPLPYDVAVAINCLVHLVQLRWDGHEDMIPALNDDDLAALNACFGTDWGDRGLSWECDRPAATTIRALGEAQADTDDPYWQSLAELHASRMCLGCGGPADHVRGQCRGEAAGKFMCPHCGFLFDERGPDGCYWREVPAHGDETEVPGRSPGMYVCPGVGQVWRNPLTDGRPLGNGEANPYRVEGQPDDLFHQALADLLSGKCPACGGAPDHFQWECRDRADQVADGPPSEASRKAVQTIVDATLRQMAEDAGPVTRIEFPGEVMDDETAKALRAARMSDDPDDLFVGWTSNATVGTFEAPRCSFDECPVCGDEPEPTTVECDEGHRWELLGSEWPTRCPFCEDLS